MDVETARAARRAIADTAAALLCAAAFVLSWVAPHLGDELRRVVAFGASIAFVVFYREAERSWLRAGERRGARHA